MTEMQAAAAWPGEDDLWASGGLPARVATPDPEPEEVLDLNRLPNELLQKVLSYLPPSTLLRHCRQVCRRWRDVVDDWGLWRSILPWKYPDLWPVIRTCLPPADDPGPCILGRFCERRPIGRNLLLNPHGLGFLNQTMLSAGAAWGVEENARVGPPMVDMQSWFLSTYRWCQQKQVLDLEKEGLWWELLDSGKIEICVSNWWFDDRDAVCLYRLIVQLLDANKAVLHHFSPLPFPTHRLGKCFFFEVNHVFSNLKKGVRFVCIEQWVRGFEFLCEQLGDCPLHPSVTVRLRQALPDHAFHSGSGTTG